MNVGDNVRVRAYKADGTCYRWWQATVEAVEMDGIVLVTAAGHRVRGIDGGWTSQYAIRSFYWPDRPYSVLEAYTPDGELAEIYVNISSPAVIGDSELRFTDYELDVSRKPPHRAHLEDEDEFREAAARYGYTKAFQRSCYRVAREAIDLANQWEALGTPAIEGPGGAHQ